MEIKLELEVGMYVRLQNDVEDIVIINKIANVFETTILTENDGSNYQGEYTKENVVKASYDIIDLIEVGDYVNGYYVEDVLESFINVATGSNYFQSPTIYENDIKSIVTKEQFSRISYNLPKDK